MIVYVLWLITSTYAVPVATYPSVMMCAHILVEMDASLAKPPRAVMARIMCVPTMVLPQGLARPPSPSGSGRPSAES